MVKKEFRGLEALLINAAELACRVKRRLQ